MRVDKRKPGEKINRFSGDDAYRVYKDREFTPDEVEFARAMENFRRLTGKKFPTCADVLGVIRKLGYEKQRST